jgi:hypothetical protein
MHHLPDTHSKGTNTKTRSESDKSSYGGGLLHNSVCLSASSPGGLEFSTIAGFVLGKIERQCAFDISECSLMKSLCAQWI